MWSIKCKNINVYYDNICALENINIEIENKDFLGIIGPNGGGKTTFLKVLLGILKPDSGEIFLAKHAKIGYVPQFSTFNREFPISVFDCVLMGNLDKKMKLFYNYSKMDFKRTEVILKRLGIYNLKDRHISELSGGQIQKVLIGRAVVSNANILILDEPTASLDPESKNEIYDILKEINKSSTIILVSHDMGVISAHVKNVACLNKNLFYHGDSENVGEGIQKAYGCPIDIIAHGLPHRVFKDHRGHNYDK